MTPKNADVTPLVDELAGLLERLAALQTSVNQAIREKLEAMRRADADQIMARSLREGELAAEITHLDKTRVEVVARLCLAVGINPVEKGRTITLRELIRRMSGRHRDRLAAVANELRERMLVTAESNRVVEIVCHEMMAHFKAIFAAMTAVGGMSGTYCDRGRQAVERAPMALDAVG